MMQRQRLDTPNARDTVPRVVHLGYFDAVLDGVRGGLTFDELRLRLITVSNDLARFHGRRLPSQRTDPSTLWSTTRDALEGLMRCGLVEDQQLPSRKEALTQHADRKYALGRKGRDLLSQASVGAQREMLGAALYQAHPYFRRYLERLQKGPLFFPEFSETDMDRLQVRAGWNQLALEVVERAAVTPAKATYDSRQVASFLHQFVTRRFAARGGHGPSRRKELLDAVLDGIVGFISHAEGVGADAATVSVLHEWGRQLFLIGSSRYVADNPTGWLHWSASTVEETQEGVIFHRKVLPAATEAVIPAMAVAYRSHLRAGTRLVEYYRFRGTTGFLAAVSNDVVDRVVVAMITGQVPNPYGLQPSSGAQWTPPPSERPLRIGDRRYTLINFTRDLKED